MVYPDIQTERLILSFFDPDVEAHYAKVYRSQSHKIQSYADIDARSKAHTIPAGMCHKSPPLEYPYLVCHRKEGGEYVGFVSVFFRGEDKTSVWNTQMGWAILPEHRGKGYATEAVIALVSFCDQFLGLERVAAMVLKDNTTSRRVAEKAGGQIRESRMEEQLEGKLEYEWVFRNAA